MGMNSSLKLKSNNLLIGLLATHMEKKCDWESEEGIKWS